MPYTLRLTGTVSQSTGAMCAGARRPMAASACRVEFAQKLFDEVTKGDQVLIVSDRQHRPVFRPDSRKECAPRKRARVNSLVTINFAKRQEHNRGCSMSRSRQRRIAAAIALVFASPALQGGLGPRQNFEERLLAAHNRERDAARRPSAEVGSRACALGPRLGAPSRADRALRAFAGRSLVGGAGRREPLGGHRRLLPAGIDGRPLGRREARLQARRFPEQQPLRPGRERQPLYAAWSGHAPAPWAARWSRDREEDVLVCRYTPGRQRPRRTPDLIMLERALFIVTIVGGATLGVLWPLSKSDDASRPPLRLRSRSTEAPTSISTRMRTSTAMTIRFLVDTGASEIALTEEDARKAGIADRSAASMS